MVQLLAGVSGVGWSGEDVRGLQRPAQRSDPPRPPPRPPGSPHLHHDQQHRESGRLDNNHLSVAMVSIPKDSARFCLIIHKELWMTD